MNKREKELVELLYGEEQAVLKDLEKQYTKTLDEINLKIRILQSDELTQSKVYQLQYQQALKKQIEGLVEKLHGDQYSTIQEYLHDSYTTGFVGTMYDVAGQGIPMILPIDQNAAVKAILTDSKLNDGLYDALGVDTNKLKKTIRQEITRGIAGGMTYNDIARNITNATKTPLSNAKRIAVTEGHRIQQAATYDAQKASKAKGADVVKQWDSTLDGATRPTHRKLDGQICEVDEPFEEDGKKAMFPGDFGDPAEDCNCRCVSLTRARWALDEDELQTLKDRAAFFELDKSKDFEDFQKKYLKAAEALPETTPNKYVPAKTIEEAEMFAKNNGVQYADYSKLPLETANELNRAITTLPDDVRPAFVGDSTTLEKYWGGKLPRSSKNFYGVTMDAFNGMYTPSGFDPDAYGQMVGISSSYKTASKITASKLKTQAAYQNKYGNKWFFNEYGEATPFHEIGHVYANVKGLPNGFEEAAKRWAKESGCDMLKNPAEAWSEAWGAFFTSNKNLPDYISSYISKASSSSVVKNVNKTLLAFDDSGIIKEKISAFADDLAKGKIKTTISPQKQARHIFGSKEFTAYSERLSVRGDYPSYIRDDLTVKDLSEIVKNKLGTGIIEVKNDNSIQEFFDCDSVIGYYYDKTEGKYVPTKRVQVKYSPGDGNIHVIPVKEK